METSTPYMVKHCKNILSKLNKRISEVCAFLMGTAKTTAPRIRKGTVCLLKRMVIAFLALAGSLKLFVHSCFKGTNVMYRFLVDKGHIFWESRNEKTKQMIFSCSVSLVLVACVALILATTCSIGFTVTANGHVVGTLRNQETYDALIEEINKEMAYVAPEGFSSTSKLRFSKKVIAKNAFTADEDFKELLKSTNSNMLPAYCVNVNGEIIVALPNESAALAVLDRYKESFVAGSEVTSAEFCDSVTVSRRFVPRAALKTTESALEVLEDGRMMTYELKAGESLSDVAEQFDVTIDTLLRNNVIENPDNPGPCKLEIPTGKPLVYIKTVSKKTLTESIPFKTVEKEDPQLYEGSIHVEQEGAEGSRVVEACITSINGVEMSCQVLSDTVISTSVDQVVAKGTKERPAYVGTGLMTTPTNGTLSSRYGARWGRNHNGIDISAPVGTAIYAADNGIVTYAAYNNGGYGYMIQIDHGEGIMTYYAHCNELLVEEGAVVKKGDLIARVGNTGRSTGAHLHFEVRVNGTPADPSAYLQ